MAQTAEHVAQHVVPIGRRWVVRSTGAVRGRSFETKGQAMDFAKSKAKDIGGILFVHSSNGRVMERLSFQTPVPSRLLIK
jgi:hypothetical protein